MKVKCEQHIGSGGFWKVYRLRFEEEINIDAKPYRQAIFKRSLESGNSDNILRNVINYSLIKESGLPTLNFFKEIRINGNGGILGEDLNSDDRVTFVSPSNANTALASQEVPSFLRPPNARVLPEAEAFLLKKKINSISNFDKLIEDFYRDMKLTERRKALLYEDAFFFGFSHQERSVFYVIADFDNIEICEDESEVYLNNCGQILQSFYLFIIRFVEKTKIREDYERRIIKLNDQLQKVVNRNA